MKITYSIEILKGELEKQIIASNKCFTDVCKATYELSSALGQEVRDHLGKRIKERRLAARFINRRRKDLISALYYLEKISKEKHEKEKKRGGCSRR